jgi:hypothetical protein
MKHPLLLGIAALVLPFLSASAAVGTMLVQNNNLSTVVPIYDCDGTTKLYGANFSIGVYVVNPDGSIISQIGGFFTAPNPNGRFSIGQQNVGTAGGTVYLSVRVWDVRSGPTYATANISAASQVFISPILGGDVDNDPSTPNQVAQSMALNFRSFRLNNFNPPCIPEPNTLALAALGLGSLLLVNRRK